MLLLYQAYIETCKAQEDEAQRIKHHTKYLYSTHPEEDKGENKTTKSRESIPHIVLRNE